MRFLSPFIIALTILVVCIGQGPAQIKDEAEKKKRRAEIQKEINDLQERIAKLSAELAKLQPTENDAVKKELKKFQGKWITTSYEEAGKARDTKQWMHTIEGNMLTSANLTGRTVGLRTIKLDSSKSPAQIDISYNTGRREGWKVKGIYKFDGDTYTIHHGMNGKDRPASFDVKPGTDTILWVLKKAKP